MLLPPHARPSRQPSLSAFTWHMHVHFQGCEASADDVLVCMQFVSQKPTFASCVRGAGGVSRLSEGKEGRRSGWSCLADSARSANH